MVLELVEKETLAKEDLERILAPVRKRPPHNTFAGFGKRTPSDRPPIEIPAHLRRPERSSNNGGPPANAGVAGGGGSSNCAAQPGVQPAPTPPEPPTPQPQPGAFGPTTFGPPPPPTSSPYEKPGS